MPCPNRVLRNLVLKCTQKEKLSARDKVQFDQIIHLGSLSENHDFGNVIIIWIC